MTSFVEDFAAIKAALEEREAAKKPKVIVTDGEPVQWVDTVYGMYGRGNEDTAPCDVG